MLKLPLREIEWEDGDRETKRKWRRFCFVNGISTPSGSFNAGIWLICKYLVIIITIYIFNIPSFFYCIFFICQQKSFVCTVIWYKLFLSNRNNFPSVLFDPYMGPLQVLPLWVTVDQGVMKGYFTLHRAPELDPHHQMQFSNLLRTTTFLVKFIIGRIKFKKKKYFVIFCG